MGTQVTNLTWLYKIKKDSQLDLDFNTDFTGTLAFDLKKLDTFCQVQRLKCMLFKKCVTIQLMSLHFLNPLTLMLVTASQHLILQIWVVGTNWTASNQAAGENLEELTLWYWAPVGKSNSKDKFVCIQKLSSGLQKKVCKTCRSEITDEIQELQTNYKCKV